MDISENYDGTQQQQNQQIGGQQQSMSDSQMQCEPIFLPDGNCMNGLNQGHDVQMMQNNAIPLPPPPSRIVTQEIMSNEPSHQQSSISTSAAADFDIDSLLLQKFSCLGTTDHEDLINQFQCVMNNQINRDTAKFFLEMSNWNLQMAVGCFLDLAVLQTLPSMKILEQTKPSLTQQAWRLQNNGTDTWPSGCYLMSPSQERRMDIPALKPGEKCDIVADIPPSQPAVMWRLCTPNGWYFGEPIWMVPQGTCNSMEDLHQRMSQLITNEQSGTSMVSSTGGAGGGITSLPQITIVVSSSME